jgi:hypothetical protein
MCLDHAFDHPDDPSGAAWTDGRSFFWWIMITVESALIMKVTSPLAPVTDRQ